MIQYLPIPPDNVDVRNDTQKKLLVLVIPLLLVILGYWWGQTDGRSGDSFPALMGSANAQAEQSSDMEEYRRFYTG